MVVCSVVRMKYRKRSADPGDWLTRVVASCRALVDRPAVGDGRAALGQLARLVHDMPPSASSGERLLVSALIGEVTFFVVRRAGTDTLALDAARAELARSADSCEPTVTSHPAAAATSPLLDARIHGALQFIDAHYSEPRLTLGAVATHVGLSRFHLARRLTTQTGHGFRVHLHRARIREAERLLRGTSLSVKEVAATVGYNDTTQLCRHFRQFRGTSPARFAARGMPQQRMMNRNN